MREVVTFNAGEPEGLEWQTLTEDDHLAASGNVERTGKANPTAQRWADSMTARFPSLAVADPVFGQLQGCMDLSIVAALIVKEGLAEKAGFGMPFRRK